MIITGLVIRIKRRQSRGSLPGERRKLFIQHCAINGQNKVRERKDGGRMGGVREFSCGHGHFDIEYTVDVHKTVVHAQRSIGVRRLWLRGHHCRVVTVVPTSRMPVGKFVRIGREIETRLIQTKISSLIWAPIRR
jgi:hypothetical protein